MVKRALFLLLAFLPDVVSARPSPAAPGMVAASDPRAAEAGRAILKAGGSATDAAIATMLALGIVEPQNSGIGGGGFLIHYDPATRRTDGYNGREAAPKAADPRWFYRSGAPLPIREAIPGGRSVGVPGNLRMMALAHAAHGHLPWARLFEPAIRLARDGFVVTPRLNAWIARYGDHVDAWGRAHLFQPDGQALAVGTRFRNPEAAALLARIAVRGANAFYSGEAAAKLVATVNGADRNPSKMTVADVAGYRAQALAPVCGRYRVWRICGMAPPSSGGVMILQILKQLERFDMKALGPTSPVAWHLLAESQRLAYADRNLYLADADFVSVPVAGLTDPAYLAGRSALIATDATMPKAAAGQPAGAPPRKAASPGPETGTSHIVAVDRRGDVATVTSTIEAVWGSGLTIDGIFLNNELTDFDFVPAKDGVAVANRVEGGKRPRSSMAPTIVWGPDGQVRVAIGAAGGSTIPAQVAKALVAMLDWGMSAEDAIALPLLYAPGPGGVVEKGSGLEAMLPALAALGETLRPYPLGLKANAIERVGGRWIGAADPRSEGAAIGEGDPPFDLARTLAKAVPVTPE